MSPSCVPPHARSGGFVDAWRPSLASTPCQRRLGVTILKARRISIARDGQAMMDLRLRTGGTLVSFTQELGRMCRYPHTHQLPIDPSLLADSCGGGTCLQVVKSPRSSSPAPLLLLLTSGLAGHAISSASHSHAAVQAELLRQEALAADRLAALTESRHVVAELESLLGAGVQVHGVAEKDAFAFSSWP